MSIKFLQAHNGDSIIVSFVDDKGVKRNILIDGGTKSTYQSKNAKGKLEDGQLKTEIDIIENNKEQIDLLILTHVDDDHIGGLLKWVESNKNFHKLVKYIWFNSGNLINQEFDLEGKFDNSIELSVRTNTDTTIKQGVTFEEYITKLNVWHKELITQKNEFNIYGVVFQVLTPSRANLEKLLYKWSKEAPDSLTSQTNDYQKTINQLIAEDIYVEDNSVHNGSSISFIIKHNNKIYLHLSDAHPSDIVMGLKCFGYNENNKLKADLVKLSHHGSKKNMSLELLNTIESSLFVISSNGKIHNLPDKQCLARIIKNKPNSTLAFNYSNKISEIFTEDDFNSYKFIPASIDKEILL